MHFKMFSVICFSLDQSKILPSGNGFSLKESEIFLSVKGLTTDLVFFVTFEPLRKNISMHVVFLYPISTLFQTTNCRLFQT